MNATSVKLLRVFLPLPLLALMIAAALSLLNWSLVAGTGLLAIDERIVDFWLPCAAAAAGVFAVIHPRLRVLSLNEARSVPLLYDIAAIAAVVVPAIIAQLAVHDATDTVMHVADASQIVPGEAARYFTTERICLDRDALVSDIALNAGGRSDVAVDLYVAVPICRAGGGKSAAWIGFVYHTSLNRDAGDAAMDAEYKAFARRSQDALNAEDPQTYRYLEKLSLGAERRSFEKALRKADIDPGGAVILTPHATPFEAHNSHRLIWLIASFVAGSAVWFALVMMAPLAPLRLVEARNIANAKEDAFLIALLVPKRGRYALPLLLDVNILVYLAMVLAGLGVMTFQTDDLLDWGANYRPAMHGLGLLRLFTSQFVHGGLLHLASNMYGLLIAAIFLSPASSNLRLIAWYLLCGLGGSLASVFMHPDTVSVGASGAVFGLFGIALTLTLLKDKRFGEAGRFIWTNAAIFVAMNLAFGAATPGIDNAAHIGGLLSGLAIGLATYFYDRRSA